ncbi:MAG: FtsX-like permease family protein, partial [Pedobacter sp.]
SSESALEVTGIMENCPSNSQLKFDMVASFSTLGPAQETTYFNANYTTYLLLKNEQSIASLQKKIGPFMKQEMAEFTNTTLTYLLEPMAGVHLYSQYEGFEPNSSITYIYILGGIAALILAIACFTYINLSTARSMERAKEVGIRKVSGALKQQLFWQFIGDSTLTALLSLVSAFVIALLIMPYFNHLSDRQFVSAQLADPALIGYSLLIVMIISIAAGSYPAVIISGFNPVTVLKGSFKNTGSGVWLRKSLTVFQFVISVFLIIATFTIQSQLHYIRNKKLGYDREQVLVLPSDGKVFKAMDLIKTEFNKNRNVRSVSMAYNTPNHILGGYSMKSNKMTTAEYMAVTANPVDQDFIRTSGMQIIAGSDFTLQDMKDVIDPVDST